MDKLPVNEHLDSPSVARVYDYYLGGTTNWDVDRRFADQVLERFPLVRRIAFVHRLFLNRVVRYLLGQGVRQFLDVGSGMPSAGAAHDVADEWALLRHELPDSRVIYADNDPVAVAHATLCLDRQGDRDRHAAIYADLRCPEDLVEQAAATELLNLDEPVGLLLVGVLHLQQPDLDGSDIGPESVAKLCELLPIGSYAAISHVSYEAVSPDVQQTLAGLKQMYDDSGSGSVTWRSRAAIEAMLGDWRVVQPGWTAAGGWHSEDTGPHAPEITLPSSSNAVVWAGVAKKA
jgi:hypothetical protein